VPPEFYFNLYADQKKLPRAKIGDWAYIHDVPKDASEPNTWRGKRKREEIERARAGYYGSIHHIDHQIGRLFSELRKSKLLSESLIFSRPTTGICLGIIIYGERRMLTKGRLSEEQEMQYLTDGRSLIHQAGKPCLVSPKY
jgi:hypothetical protein